MNLFHPSESKEEAKGPVPKKPSRNRGMFASKAMNLKSVKPING